MSARVAAVLVALITAGGAIGVGAQRARADEPTIQASVDEAAPGDTVVVTTGGWPGVVTVTTCGNEARRGAQDCDQVGGVALGGSIAAPQTRDFVITRPPAPCPCVLRGATAGDAIVKMVPITILGVPSATPRGGTMDAALAVRAALERPHAGFFTRLRSGLGGHMTRRLVVTLTNAGGASTRDIAVTAALGRSAQGGETIQIPDVAGVAAGQTTRLIATVEFGAPSFGSYVVYGTVYGPGAPVNFSLRAHNDPWLLAIVVLALAADLWTLVWFRSRRARKPAQLASLPSVQLPFEPRSALVGGSATSGS